MVREYIHCTNLGMESSFISCKCKSFGHLSVTFNIRCIPYVGDWLMSCCFVTKVSARDLSTTHRPPEFYICQCASWWWVRSTRLRLWFGSTDIIYLCKSGDSEYEILQLCRLLPFVLGISIGFINTFFFVSTHWRVFHTCVLGSIKYFRKWKYLIWVIESSQVWF